MTTRSLTPLPKGFHGDRYLLQLVDVLAKRARTFLETGSNVGSTLGYVAQRFPALECISCEPDPAAHAVAKAHACTRDGVTLHQETSQDLLRRVERERADLFARPVLAWLDAHDYGYPWPLRDEVRFLTANFARGYALIDDFRVPHDERFGWDEYGDHKCALEYVQDAIAPGVAWRLYYPAYSEHTSPWHPLRGWGLLQFGAHATDLERLDRELPEVCLHAAASADSTADLDDAKDTESAAQDAFARGDFERAIALLRAQLERDASSAATWNDLAFCLVHRGDGDEAVKALGEALRREPRHADARANLKHVLLALHPGERPLPIAPGAWGRMVARDAYEDLRDLVDVERPTIVDGGANRGDTVARLRALFPDARIHAFEPIPALAESIRARFASDLDLVVHRAALAAIAGTLRFNQLAADVTSSVFSPSALKRRYHGANVAVAKELEVLALPLAEVVRTPIDVLKLDLQGYELEALEGLGDRIAEVRVLLTEVEFVPLYEGQPLFGDLDVFLRAKGFRLFHLYDVWSHPDGQVTSGDAIYVNERFYT